MLALVPGAWPGVAAAAVEADVSLAIVSDYVAHGLTRSLGDAAVQAAVGVFSDTGWSAGAFASTANLNPGPGVNREYTLAVGYRRTLRPDLAVEAELSRYIYPGDLEIISYDYTQLRAAVALRDAVELALSVVPDASAYTSAGLARHRLLWRAELSGNQPLGRHFLLTGGVGYTDLGDIAGTGYWYGSCGLQWRVRHLRASLTLIDTDHTARRLFGGTIAGRRVVGAVVWNWR